MRGEVQGAGPEELEELGGALVPSAATEGGGDREVLRPDLLRVELADSGGHARERLGDAHRRARALLLRLLPPRLRFLAPLATPGVPRGAPKLSIGNVLKHEACNVTNAQVCANSTGDTASGPGGATTYSWSITNGSITAGQTSQTVTFTAAASGSVGLTLVVTNAAGCSATNSLSVPISSAITPARAGGGSFPAGTIGSAYTGQSFTASGGTGPYTFAVTGGTFPTNLSLAANGTISRPDSSGL